MISKNFKAVFLLGFVLVLSVLVFKQNNSIKSEVSSLLDTTVYADTATSAGTGDNGTGTGNDGGSGTGSGST